MTSTRNAAELSTEPQRSNCGSQHNQVYICLWLALERTSGVL
jgi:hypothetical protein